jgi:hypothetical protein
VDIERFALLANKGFRTRALIAILKYPVLVWVVLQVRNAGAAVVRLFLRLFGLGKSNEEADR